MEDSDLDALAFSAWADEDAFRVLTDVLLEQGLVEPPRRRPIGRRRRRRLDREAMHRLLEGRVRGWLRKRIGDLFRTHWSSEPWAGAHAPQFLQQNIFLESELDGLEEVTIETSPIIGFARVRALYVSPAFAECFSITRLDVLMDGREAISLVHAAEVPAPLFTDMDDEMFASAPSFLNGRIVLGLRNLSRETRRFRAVLRIILAV